MRKQRNSLIEIKSTICKPVDKIKGLSIVFDGKSSNPSPTVNLKSFYPRIDTGSSFTPEKEKNYFNK